MSVHSDKREVFVRLQLPWCGEMADIPLEAAYLKIPGNGTSKPVN